MLCSATGGTFASSRSARRRGSPQTSSPTACGGSSRPVFYMYLVQGLIQTLIGFGETADQTVPPEVMCAVDIYTAHGGDVQKVANIHPDRIEDIGDVGTLLGAIKSMDPIDIAFGVAKLVPGSSCGEVIVNRMAPGQAEAFNECRDRYDLATCLGWRSSPVYRDGTPVVR